MGGGGLGGGLSDVSNMQLNEVKIHFLSEVKAPLWGGGVFSFSGLIIQGQRPPPSGLTLLFLITNE